MDVGGLMAQQAFMRGLMDRMRGEMDTLLHLNGELVRSIVTLCVSIHHGRDNPIVIEDDNEVVDTAPVDHTLVEIVEETPEREVVDDCQRANFLVLLKLLFFSFKPSLCSISSLMIYDSHDNKNNKIIASIAKHEY